MRLMPSIVKYGSTCVTVNVRYDFAVLMFTARLVPEPNTLSCDTPADSTTLSVDEKPAPSVIAPVGFSATFTSTSTWSAVPSTGIVVTSTSVK